MNCAYGIWVPEVGPDEDVCLEEQDTLWVRCVYSVYYSPLWDEILCLNLANDGHYGSALSLWDLAQWR